MRVTAYTGRYQVQIELFEKKSLLAPSSLCIMIYILYSMPFSRSIHFLLACAVLNISMRVTKNGKPKCINHTMLLLFLALSIVAI